MPDGDAGGEDVGAEIFHGDNGAGGDESASDRELDQVHAGFISQQLRAKVVQAIHGMFPSRSQDWNQIRRPPLTGEVDDLTLERGTGSSNCTDGVRGAPSVPWGGYEGSV